MSIFFSGTGMFSEILDSLGRIPTFDKSDIFRRKSELRKAIQLLKTSTDPEKSRKPVERPTGKDQRRQEI